MQYGRTMTAAFVLTMMGFVLCSSGFAKEDKDFVPGEDSGFYYTIKKGDTLWDLFPEILQFRVGLARTLGNESGYQKPPLDLSGEKNQNLPERKCSGQTRNCKN